MTQQCNNKVEGHVEKAERYFEPFEKNLTEPKEQQPKKILQHNCKMERAQYQPHVGLNFLAVFFKVLMDLCCEKPGDQIRDANGPDLHKADRVRKILTQPLEPGM